jgi:hypothetical protein
MGVAALCPGNDCTNVVFDDTGIYRRIKLPVGVYSMDCVGPITNPTQSCTMSGWRKEYYELTVLVDRPVGNDIFRDSAQCPGCGSKWRNASAAADPKFYALWYGSSAAAGAIGVGVVNAGGVAEAGRFAMAAAEAHGVPATSMWLWGYQRLTQAGRPIAEGLQSLYNPIDDGW